MKETAMLKAEVRTGTSKGATHLLRRNGNLPGVVSVKGKDSVPVTIRKDEFRKALHRFGRNSVFKLDLADGKSFTVVVREIQFSPMVNDYYHVDFQQVSLSESVKTEVAIRLIGLELLESKKLLPNKQLENILVEGFPQNIPDAIEIDVSEMKADDIVKISDIQLPEGITTDIAPSHVILTVNEIRTGAAPVAEEE